MSFQEIPLLDYIDEDYDIDLYIHTKDNRVVKLEEIKTNLYIDNYQVSIDHVWFGQTMTFVMLREDFSYMRYMVKSRMPGRHTPENVIADDFNSQDIFDDINSFVEEQIEDFNPSDTPTEPDERLYEDLI